MFFLDSLSFSFNLLLLLRAMETVINEHGIDVDSLKSSRGPLTGGTHMGDSSSNQFAGKFFTYPIAITCGSPFIA